MSATRIGGAKSWHFPRIISGNTSLAPIKKSKDSATQIQHQLPPVLQNQRGWKEEASPLSVLTERSAFPDRVTWNFQKYLVDRSGHITEKHDPGMSPCRPPFWPTWTELWRQADTVCR